MWSGSRNSARGAELGAFGFRITGLRPGITGPPGLDYDDEYDNDHEKTP